jgi:hypothetical protein
MRKKREVHCLINIYCTVGVKVFIAKSSIFSAVTSRVRCCELYLTVHSN